MSTMPLEDGTNAEKEDPVPALGWTSAADLKDVKVYGNPVSPPCFKIMLFLKFYKIPFEVIKAEAGKGITEKSSYKKIPVMTASGRTVNDSSVIVKQILLACASVQRRECVDQNSGKSRHHRSCRCVVGVRRRRRLFKVLQLLSRGIRERPTLR